MTSSNGNIFRSTGPLCGEFTGHRWNPSQKPVTRSFDVFFDLCPNKRLSEQLWGWWFETSSRSLWRYSNDICMTRNYRSIILVSSMPYRYVEAEILYMNFVICLKGNQLPLVSRFYQHLKQMTIELFSRNAVGLKGTSFLFGLMYIL